MSGELCQRCKSVGHDRRTIYVSCFYDMMETGIPFEHQTVQAPEIRMFTLRVCKGCRAEFLSTMSAWFQSPRSMKIDESGNYEMSKEEYTKLTGKE